MRKETMVAGLAWLLVAGQGVLEIADVNDDNWEVSYGVFTVALVVGVALSLVVAARATQETDRPRLRAVGLGVTVLGGAAAFVAAWALPLWMTILAAGFAVISLACPPEQRRAVGLLAAGQLAGLVVLFAGLLAEVGRRDEWGDHPVAGGMALVVTAAVVLAGLAWLAKPVDRAVLPA